jgi:hypothetical protein
MFLPTIVLAAPSTGERSGVLSELIGVGTATIKNLASLSFSSSSVKSTVDCEITIFPTSLVGSIPYLYIPIFSLFKSKPITFTFLANVTAKGIPTYPFYLKFSYINPYNKYSF